MKRPRCRLRPAVMACSRGPNGGTKGPRFESGRNMNDKSDPFALSLVPENIRLRVRTERLAGEMNEFAELVAKMRAAQRRYFSQRDRDTLIESKRLEAEVDRFLKARIAA